MKQTTDYHNEEKLNTVSHSLGAVLAIFGTFLLLSKNSDKTNFATFGILVYSFTLVAMLAISAAYHRANNPKLKQRLRVLDHINIYFLIAGTYTPVALIMLEKGQRMDHFLRCMGYRHLRYVL